MAYFRQERAWIKFVSNLENGRLFKSEPVIVARNVILQDRPPHVKYCETIVWDVPEDIVRCIAANFV